MVRSGVYIKKPVPVRFQFWQYTESVRSGAALYWQWPLQFPPQNQPASVGGQLWIIGMPRVRGAHTGSNIADAFIDVLKIYKITEKLGYFMLDNAV
jgi:hypothetical protein